MDKVDLIIQQYPHIWKTRSAFLTWVKGVVRKGWSRHPVKLEYIKHRRIRIPNPNPKGKAADVWGGRCEICGNLFPQKDMEVDHASNESARLTKVEQIQSCIEQLLFVVEEDLRWVCKTCHSVHSYSQKMGISFSEALLEKQVVAFKKLPVAQQKEILTNQCNCCIISNNAKGRIEQYRQWLIEKEKQ